VLLALCLIVTGSPVMAQSMAALEAQLREHPALDVYALRAAASRERADGADALPDPEIGLGIHNFPINDPGFDRYLPTYKSLSVRQAFPSRAGREASSEQAMRQSAYLEAAREARFAQLRAELIGLLHERERIRRQRLLAHESEARYAELLETVEAQVDAGQPVVYRLARIAVERAEIERRLADLAGEDSRVEARLIELLGQVPDTPAPAVAVTEWSGAPEQFHAVQLAQVAAGVAAAGVDKAQAAWKPSWGAELVYQQREAGNGEPGSTFDGDDWVSGRVTFTVPLWAKGSQDPMLRAAQAEEAAAEAEVLAAARSARADHAALDAYRLAAIQNNAVLARKIGSFEDQLKSQLSLYESGAGTYEALLDGEIAILTLRAESAAEDARIAATAARMNALLVTP
jgi:outer membrane protein TolC